MAEVALHRVGSATAVGVGDDIVFDVRLGASNGVAIGAAVVDVALADAWWANANVQLVSGVDGSIHRLGADLVRVACVDIGGVGDVVRISATVGTATGADLPVHVTLVDAVRVDGLPIPGSFATAFVSTTRPPLSILTSDLPAAHRDLAYHRALRASDTAATWAVTQGQLPPGLSLAPTGVLSGTPTAEGSWPITVRADADLHGDSVTGEVSIRVAEAPLRIATTSLPPLVDGTPYSAALDAAGGRQPLTWSASRLPPGLSVDGAKIVGTPSFRRGDPDPWPIDVRVDDADSDRPHHATHTIEVARRAAAAIGEANVGPIVAMAAGHDLVTGRYRVTVTGNLVRGADRDDSVSRELEEAKNALLDDILSGGGGIPGLPGVPDGGGVPGGGVPGGGVPGGGRDPVDPGDPGWPDGPGTGGPDDGPSRNKMSEEQMARLALYKQLDELSKGTVIMRSTATVFIDDDEIARHPIGDLTGHARMTGRQGGKRAQAAARRMHAMWAPMLESIEKRLAGGGRDPTGSDRGEAEQRKRLAAAILDALEPNREPLAATPPAGPRSRRPASRVTPSPTVPASPRLDAAIIPPLGPGPTSGRGSLPTTGPSSPPVPGSTGSSSSEVGDSARATPIDASSNDAVTSLTGKRVTALIGALDGIAAERADRASSEHTMSAGRITAADIFDLVVTRYPDDDATADDDAPNATTFVELTPGRHSLDIEWAGQSLLIGSLTSAAALVATVQWTVTITGSDPRGWGRFEGSRSWTTGGRFSSGDERIDIELANSAIDLVVARHGGSSALVVDTMSHGHAIVAFPVTTDTDATTVHVFEHDPHGRSSVAFAAGPEVALALNDGIDGWRTSRVTLDDAVEPLAAARRGGWPVVYAGGRSRVWEVDAGPAVFAGSAEPLHSSAAVGSPVVDDPVSALVAVVAEVEVTNDEPASPPVAAIDELVNRLDTSRIRSVIERTADRSVADAGIARRSPDLWDIASLPERVAAAAAEGRRAEIVERLPRDIGITVPIAGTEDRSTIEQVRRRIVHRVVGTTIFGPSRFVIDPDTGIVEQQIPATAQPGVQPTALLFDVAERGVLELQRHRRRIEHRDAATLAVTSMESVDRIVRPSSLVAGPGGFGGVCCSACDGRTVVALQREGTERTELLLHQSLQPGLLVASAGGVVAVAEHASGRVTLYR